MTLNAISHQEIAFESITYSVVIGTLLAVVETLETVGVQAFQQGVVLFHGKLLSL